MKKTGGVNMNQHFPKLLLAILLSSLLMIGLTNAKSTLKTGQFNGFLFSKLASIGTKSEGPAYFLQYRNYKDIKIIKHARLWERDPQLEKYLGRNVQITGYITSKMIDYTGIQDWRP
jgi:hypothetical protein